jgi:hypothetical protein
MSSLASSRAQDQNLVNNLGSLPPPPEDKPHHLIEGVAKGPYENISIDEAYQHAGGFGRFGWYMMITMILGMNSAGVITYGIVFMELEPQYLCTKFGYPSPY